MKVKVGLGWGAVWEGERPGAGVPRGTYVLGTAEAKAEGGPETQAKQPPSLSACLRLLAGSPLSSRAQTQPRPPAGHLESEFAVLRAALSSLPQGDPGWME